MNTIFLITIITLPALAIGVLAYRSFKGLMNGISSRRILKKNLLGFAICLVLISSLMLGAYAADVNTEDAAAATPIAEEAEAVAQEAAPADNSKGLGLLAAGLVTGLAGIGGGIAVAAGAPAAIAATSEDPKSFGKSLIFVALGESIALYGVVISILIIGKV